MRPGTEQPLGELWEESPLLWPDLAERVQRLLREGPLSERTLAQRLGMPRTTLRRHLAALSPDVGERARHTAREALGREGVRRLAELLTEGQGLSAQTVEELMLAVWWALLPEPELTERALLSRRAVALLERKAELRRPTQQVRLTLTQDPLVQIVLSLLGQAPQPLAPEELTALLRWEVVGWRGQVPDGDPQEARLERVKRAVSALVEVGLARPVPPDRVEATARGHLLTAGEQAGRSPDLRAMYAAELAGLPSVLQLDRHLRDLNLTHVALTAAGAARVRELLDLLQMQALLLEQEEPGEDPERQVYTVFTASFSRTRSVGEAH